ncbi:unnamed protein product [Prorocentrum cordatum]|uniref:Uncharacterized protein n=1 Tax=Prorocentrum cordatum TaxID=2364126 RepID=A0ABN9XX21_9DINO|nr:unnamed protein product [Polarella glacialis]
MHLKSVITRPMKFAQDCLFSRVAYESHDYTFFDFDYFDWLEHPWAWWIMYQDCKAAHTEAELKKEEAEVPPNYCDDAEGYERFKRGRHASYLFLYTEGKAPVWTGEMGTNKRSVTDCYWQHLLKLYKEFDSSWCYWPVDPIRGPIDNKADTYGLFDPSFKDYRAVVGWRLQDLISIQGTRSDFPSSALVPETCVFDVTANEASVQSVTTLWEMLTTTNWSFWSLLWFLLLVLACLACCIPVKCCAYLCLQRKRGVVPQDQARLLEKQWYAEELSSLISTRASCAQGELQKGPTCGSQALMPESEAGG